MKKTKKTQSSKKKVWALFLVFVFVWINSLQAENNKPNYFEDLDQDGLTNEEERALGTDPNNEDSDGDGYSDGVETTSGYDPLIAAPGDRLIAEEIKVEAGGTLAEESAEEEVNLTEEFIKKLKNEKGAQIGSLQNLANTSEDEYSEEEMETLASNSLTEEDINSLVSSLSQEVDLTDEVELIPEEDLNILPEPNEKDEAEKKEIERKQIEEYFVMMGFVLASKLPFEAQTEEDFSDKMKEYILGISYDIETGDKSEAQKMKEDMNAALEELKKIETPFVLKDFHQNWVSLLGYLISQNEEKMFDKDDPIAMGLMAGKLQAALNEFKYLEFEASKILDQYEINTEE